MINYIVFNPREIIAFHRGRRSFGILALLLILLLSVVPVAASESWGAALFPEKRHDFGRVAIGADTEFRFALKNIYVQDVKLLGVQSSCGCTNASLSSNLVKSGDTGNVIAKLNTSGQHTREKSATLSVQLETVVDGRVLRDTIQLFVTAYIRPDVVLTPGIVEFGAVREGHAVERTLTLEYAGRGDWALTKIERTSPNVHAKAEEIKRTSSEVAYKITVTLKDNAPVGYVKDALRFLTNERKPGSGEPNEIVLPIQGVVMARVHARPSPFLVGILSPGESVAKNIVIRSEEPFRIMGVDANDKRFRFTFAEEESHIQIVSVLFSAKNGREIESADLTDQIRIRTNLPDQEFVTIDALARIERSEDIPAKNDSVFESPIVSPVAVTADASGFVAKVQTVTETSVSEPTASADEPEVRRTARFGTPRVDSSKESPENRLAFRNP